MDAQRIKAGLHRIVGLKVASRTAAWTWVAAIALLALAPAGAVTRTGLGGHFDHVVAYAGAAFLAAAAYRPSGRLVAALLVYAGALELLQHFAPGRTPSGVDYMFSAIGILIGTGALVLLGRSLHLRKLPRPPQAT